MSIERIVEDWPRVKERWEAWWEGEMCDRVLLCVTAPRDGTPPREEPDVAPQTGWTDAEFIARLTLEKVSTTYFGGEALPAFWHGWSVGHALYFGCRPHFTENTVWVDPAPVDEGGYPSLTGWRQSPWLRWMFESTEAAVRASEGRYFVMPMWGNHAGDNLALVRGTERLLIDIADAPSWVKSAMKTISDIQIEVFDELWHRVPPDKVGIEGSLNYASCWSPGRTLGFDCDVSCMISPESFNELFLPPLIETMHTVDHRIYHLDGPGAFQHLDALLDLAEVQAIQWVPGAGQKAILQWIPLIQRIQGRGKSIIVYATPEEIEPLLQEVQPEGLCISTQCETEQEARRLLASVDRLS